LKSPSTDDGSSSSSSSSRDHIQQQQQQKKNTLVLIDGTWSEAKRIIRRSPEVLEGCQMVQFAFDDDEEDNDGNIEGARNGDDDDDDNDDLTSSWPTTSKSSSDTSTNSRSIYHAMRKEPEEHCLSTLEACGEALKILEGADGNGPKIQNRLNTVLTKHVELHLKNAREASQSRHNRDTTSRDTKLRRAKEIERSIYGSSMNSRGHDDMTTTTIDDTPT